MRKSWLLCLNISRKEAVHTKIIERSNSTEAWNNQHILFRNREVSKNVFFIQEKYFEFSWNLANIFFIKVNIKFLIFPTLSV